MRISKRLRSLLGSSGLILFVLRLPFRLTKAIADLATTRLYGMFLGSMGSGSHIEFGVRIESPRNVHLGKNVRIGKGTLIVSEIASARLRIGDSVQINRSCHIDHTGNLEIGASSLISEGVIIYSHSHGNDPRSSARPIEKKIGENCWIGARSMILENASVLPNNTLVAAGSVVTKSFESDGKVLAGLPAKEITDR